MKDLKDIIQNDTAFENLFIQTMHKVGRERDKERIKVIHDLSAEDFRQVIGARSGMVVPLWQRVVKYAVAACVACILVLGGGVCGVQFSAYHQTSNIGDRYLTKQTSDIFHITGEVSEATSENLETLFSNVAEGKNLKETIKRLNAAYSQSTDNESEYNYFRNAIAWNLSMAYLKTGNREEAKPILEAIVSDPKNEDKAIQDDAQQALNEIHSVFSLW